MKQTAEEYLTELMNTDNLVFKDLGGEEYNEEQMLHFAESYHKSQTEWISLEDLISKFKDGDNRFMKSALVNKSVMCLMNDYDPILLIDDLIQIIDNQHKEFEEYLKSDTRPMSFKLPKPPTK